MLNDVLDSIDSDRKEAVAGLADFLRIPSVSTKPQHAGDCRDCAQWLAQRLKECDLGSQVIPTGGHPIVLARNEQVKGRPTVLTYGHYDVQPPEPLEQWTSPAFEPAIRDGAIYARGACDDKGQVWAHVSAAAAWQKHGGVPVNLILLIEGEEEIGSKNLPAFIREHREELRDVAVVSDTSQFARGLPAITYGLRGLVYMEVTVSGPDHDLHSGVYGGAVPNPANVLCEILASLHDADGRVAIAGFYDEILALSEQERELWRQLPFDEEQFRRESNAPALQGEKGFSALERKWARPTCDINGLSSGYQGAGAKTIIPSAASAKVSMRLVPNQDPAKITKAFESTIRQRAPRSVKVDVTTHSYTAPMLTPREGPAMRCAQAAVEKGFGQRPALIREGGSIPVVSHIKSILGIDTLLVGFGLPDDRIHSPNEKFDLDALHKGTRTAAALYDELSRLKR